MAQKHRSREARAPAPSPTILGPPDRAWQRLTKTIWGCTQCPLARGRTHAVAYRGAPRPWLVLVGEAPGAEEDRTGLPFVGRGGRLLDRTLVHAGIREEEYGIVNVLKCRPPENRFDRRAAITCRPYLDRQLELLDPNAVVSLGAQALRALDPTAPPVLKAAGRARAWGARALFPMIHPAATFRSRTLARRWRTDAIGLAAWAASLRGTRKSPGPRARSPARIG